MAEAKHTPTPWEVDERTISVWSKEHGTVCKCSTANSWLEAQANAEFIVRACNSFDDLLAACKAAALVLSGNAMSKSELIRALELCSKALHAAKADKIPEATHAD